MTQSVQPLDVVPSAFVPAPAAASSEPVRPHWFSSDAFLHTFAEVYFPGQACQIGMWALGGKHYRLLSPGGGKPVTSWTFFDFLMPLPEAGPARSVSFVPHTVLDTRELSPEKPELPPTLDPAPFIRWDRFPDWAAFEKHFVARRSSLPRDSRQKKRNIEKDIGPYRFVLHDPRPEVFEQCYAWKSAQYDRTGVVDHFAVPANRRFFERLNEKGCLQVSTLSGGDLLLAVHFGARDGDRLYSWIAAYDPARGRYSPGRLLLEHMLRESMMAGHREWDFGIGDTDYKWHYASDLRVVGAIGSPSLSARLEAAARIRLKPVLQKVPVVFEMARRMRKRLLDLRNARRGDPEVGG